MARMKTQIDEKDENATSDDCDHTDSVKGSALHHLHHWAPKHNESANGFQMTLAVAEHSTPQSRRSILGCCSRRSGAQPRPLSAVPEQNNSTIQPRRRRLYFGIIPCYCCVRKIPRLPVTSGRKLCAEEYIEYRLEVLLEKFECLSPKLDGHYNRLWVMVILLTSVNAVMALMPLKQWIPIVVALGACFQSVMHDQRLEERLTATTSAITKLNNYVNWWYSLTLVERRMDENFELLVESCETVAYNDIVWSPPVTKDERVGDKGQRAAKLNNGQEGNTSKGPNPGSDTASKNAQKQSDQSANESGS